MKASHVNETELSWRNSNLKDALNTVALAVVWCLVLKAGNHSVVSVRVLSREYMDKEVLEQPPERPVYLLGESFGCVLSLAVAAKRPALVDRIVLVNPATSFEKSVWSQIGPLLPAIPRVRPPTTPY